MANVETFYEVMRRQGVTHCSFLKHCSLATASLGLALCLHSRLHMQWKRNQELRGCGYTDSSVLVARNLVSVKTAGTPENPGQVLAALQAG